MEDQNKKNEPWKRSEFKDLADYMRFIMQSSFGALAPPENPIVTYGRTVGICLDRRGQYQVELFIIPPPVEIVEFHTHPDVDAFELHMGGDFDFEAADFSYTAFPPGTHLCEKNLVWVPSTCVHGAINARSESKGTSILTIQFWKNGVIPTSVVHNFLLDDGNKHHQKGLIGKD